MKILSKKKYNQLIDDFEELQKKVEELKRINESIGKKLEDKKTSYKLNNGKDFCFSCKNSYRYKTYWGVTEIEKCGCLLDVPCEDFERRGGWRMMIDENTINHNAVRLIDDIVTDFVDNNVTECDDGYKTITIGYIKGICDMANAMKEVLKN